MSICCSSGNDKANEERSTKQQEDVARAVLAYYLVEKAIVGTAISIVYDQAPDLGWAYLAVAEMRLKSLVEMQH